MVGADGALLCAVTNTTPRGSLGKHPFVSPHRDFGGIGVCHFSVGETAKAISCPSRF